VRKEKVSIISLGCPKNLVDSERIAGKLLLSGYDFTYDPEEADDIVINTCAFLASARSEAEEVINEFLEKKKNGLVRKLIVAGCYPSLYGESMVNKFKGVNAVISTNNLNDIVSALKFEKSFVSSIPVSETLPRLKFTLPHYEYLKIADGCNHSCAFCLIPKIKGRLHSFEKDFLFQESLFLAQNGVKELIIIAQDIVQYGIDLYGEPKLIELLDRISKIPQISWIRLMYTYPSPNTYKLLKYMESNPKIVPYIDMPIQHISEKILKKMKRLTGRKEIEETISMIKEFGFALRSSIIVGLPYEGEKEFEELKDFLMKYQIDHIGVFEYSNEEGAESFSFPQVEAHIKERRLEEILKLKDSIARLRAKRLIGRKIESIIDYYDPKRKESIGRTVYDAPEVDDILIVKGQLKPSEIYEVKIFKGDLYKLAGEVSSK